jgi:hypothetical protein
MTAASGSEINFPDLFYIVSPGDNYGDATWTGINSVIKGNDNSEISNSLASRKYPAGIMDHWVQSILMWPGELKATLRHFFP